MNNREFARRLEERTKQFALQIIRLSAGLSRSPEALVIRNQITKSATSIGANYREANRSRSRADFKNRIKICESEASEPSIGWSWSVQPDGCRIADLPPFTRKAQNCLPFSPPSLKSNSFSTSGT
jgi:hypothetical protein